MRSNSPKLKITQCVICIIVAVILFIAEAQTQHESGSSKRVRVLLLNNPKAQREIEEAASLSLDLPVRETNENNVTGPRSLGYRAKSLASLTLHQRVRQVRQSDSAEQQTTSLLNRQKQATNVKKQKESVWTDAYLNRVRPSWLNVSTRFKITGSSIEELEYMMPVEYLLRQAFDSPVLLKTKLGILEGVRSIKFNKHLYTFLSVPYAKAPVENLRFRAPEALEKWEGILQATKWPPFCVQPSMTLASRSSPVHVLSQIMSEDCLYMNIWTPSLKYNKIRKRPVMVWLHGGAFQFGGISVDENDGSALALMGDVVVVTLNYRISAFGFLNANNPKSAPNNVGLLDQRMALQWVQDNIKSFGGDPTQVTLFGESAGGHSVGLHLISPASQPLFRRAIMQSGVPVSFLRSYDVNSDNKGATVAEGVGAVMMARRLKCLAQESQAFNESSTPEKDTGESNSTNSSTTIGTKIFEAADSMTDPSDTNEESDASPEGPLLTDSVLDCMRNKSSLEVLKALGAPGNAGFFPTGDDKDGFFPNGPVMESFDPDEPKIGDQKDYLIGTNTDEGTFMLHYGLPKLFPSHSVPRVSNFESLKNQLAAEIERLANSAETSTSAKSLEARAASGVSESGGQNGGAQAHLYKPLMRTSSAILEGFMPKERVKMLANGTLVSNSSLEFSKEAEFGRAVGSLITDIIFVCPARSLARTLSAAKRNVYFYVYGHRSSLSQYHRWMGVTHHDEVEFIFGRPLRLADVYSGKDIEMSQRMISLWSHFAYSGKMLDQHGVEWLKYGDEDNNYMNLVSGEASVGQRYHDKVCNVYDTIISVHLQDS